MGEAKEQTRALPTIRRGTVVLLADDEQGVRELIRRVLVRAGCEVLVASDGQTALAIADHHLDVVDLLLTDVIMPGMDGRALYDALAERRPGLPVLFISGYPRDLISDHGVLESRYNFLAKPFSTHSLLTRVNETLNERARDH